MVTKNYNNIWYATNLIPREIRCCYFIAFENFYHDFHLLVGSSVSVLTGYPWREGLLVYGRWCPLANTGSTAYGLEPGPESVFVLCVCVCFFLTFVTGTTTATESTVQRDNTHHMYNTSTFFLIFFFLCTMYTKKSKWAYGGQNPFICTLVMFLNRILREEWFNRFLWFLVYLIKNGWKENAIYFFIGRKTFEISAYVLKRLFTKNCQ